MYFLALSICGGKSCVANAHCFKYKCACDTGYVGCGYSKCESKFDKLIQLNNIQNLNVILQANEK